MPLPQGLSQQDFDSAMAELREIVGHEWVFTGDAHIETYRDPYSPLQGSDAEPIPSAAVAPHTVEHVQGVLRVANDYGIPAWAFSTGKNFGYGGTEARVAGSLMIDLKRMNRILELNEANATAIVEPGVSQYELWQEIRRRGLRLWIDGPSPAYSSIVAIGLERGVGYSLNGERYRALSGLEVVLPTGEVIRTGMAAIEGSGAWAQYPYGLGPHVQGMFSQSNYGIVTKVGVRLIQHPPAFRSSLVIAPNNEDIVPMIDTLRTLRLGGAINNAVSLGPHVPGMDPWAAAPLDPPMGGFGIPGGPGGMGGPGAPPRLPGWSFRLGLYGYDRVVEANWEEIQDEFNSAIPGASYETEKFVAPYDDQDNWESRHKMLAGIPSFQETPLWNHGGAFISMVLPFDGQAYWEFREVYDRVYRQYGRRYFGGALHNHSPWSLIALGAAPVSRDDPEANARSREMAIALIEESGRLGYGEYRAPTPFADEAAGAYAWNDHALMRFFETIKDTLDPNGILAPGKSGIWPRRYREDRA